MTLTERRRSRRGGDSDNREDGGTVSERHGTVGHDQTSQCPVFSLHQSLHLVEHWPTPRLPECWQPQVQTAVENELIFPCFVYQSQAQETRLCRTQDFSCKSEGVWGQRISSQHPPPLPSMLIHQVSEELSPILRSRKQLPLPPTVSLATWL